MAIQLKDRAQYAATHQQNTQDAFDEAMGSADGKWSSFIDDPTVKDTVKVQAAKLLDTLMDALTEVTSVQDVTELTNSFGASHAFAANPAIMALVQQAERLSPSQQASLASTARKINSGEFELRHDGAAMRPRLSAGQPAQPVAQQQAQQQAAPASPPATPPQAQQQPAAPAQPAPPAQQQGRQQPAQTAQQPPAAGPGAEPEEPAQEPPSTRQRLGQFLGLRD